MAGHVKALLEQLQTQQEAMVELCEALVSRESPSTNPAASRDALMLVASAFDAIGYRVRTSPPGMSGGYLTARPRHHDRCSPVQLLVGHVDTVWPLGTLADRPWTVRHGRASGPGVFDMKAGLVQIVFALRAIQDLRLTPEATPVVLVNSDEEVGSRDSTGAIERLSRLAVRAFVCEPGLGPRGAVKTARKGLGRYTIRITGAAAHAGLDPGGGSSAILELSAVIQQLDALNDLERGITCNVGLIEGGIRPNVVAPTSQAIVDVRVAHDPDAVMIDEAIRSIDPTHDGAVISVDGGFGRPPMERTPRNAALFDRARRIADDLGFPLAEVAAGGGSDGNTTSRYTATLDGLGPIGDNAHGPGEYIELDALPMRTALLGALLLEPALEGRG